MNDFCLHTGWVVRLIVEVPVCMGGYAAVWTMPDFASLVTRTSRKGSFPLSSLSIVVWL